MTHRRNVANLSFFYRHYSGRCSSELVELVPLLCSLARSTRYCNRLNDFFVTIPRCQKGIYAKSFFLWQLDSGILCLKNAFKNALYVDHHGWPTKKILGFRWSKKAKIMLETKALAKHFFEYFQIFSIFIYNERLLMKSHQLFKIYKRFYKKREKIVMQQSIRKEKLRKIFLFNRFFYEVLEKAINHFFFNRSFCSQDFASSFTA